MLRSPTSPKPCRPANTNCSPFQPARPFAVSLGEFKLSGGRVAFSDDLPGGLYRKTLQNLHVSLRKLQLTGGEPAALDFGFATDAGETLEHQGHVGLAPLKASGTVELTDIDLAGPKPYIAAALANGLNANLLRT